MLISKGDYMVKIHKKKIFIFLLPIIILFIGLISFSIIISNIGIEKNILIDLLSFNLHNIEDEINHPEIFLSKSNIMIKLQIFRNIWVISFSISLFFACKQLHPKPMYSTNAIFTKKKLHLMVQNIHDTLKQLKVPQNSTATLDELVYAVKCLEEKMSVESNFGYGNNEVIDCENDIGKQIELLLEAIPNIESDTSSKNINELKMIVCNINILLQKRIELKKVKP